MIEPGWRKYSQLLCRKLSSVKEMNANDKQLVASLSGYSVAVTEIGEGLFWNACKRKKPLLETMMFVIQRAIASKIVFDQSRKIKAITNVAFSAYWKSHPMIRIQYLKCCLPFWKSENVVWILEDEIIAPGVLEACVLETYLQSKHRVLLTLFRLSRIQSKNQMQ